MQSPCEAFNDENSLSMPISFYLCFSGKQDHKQFKLNLCINTKICNGFSLSSIDNMEERQSYESQIIEFGQTPKQIFTKPHPKRSVKNVDLPSEVCCNDIFWSILILL